MGTHIFIDGYNFLWASGMHRPEAIRNFEQARVHLIERLASHPRLARHQVTVVFDAHKTDTMEGSSETVGGIDVRYTRGGQQADTVLKEMASQYGSGAIIISSDREVIRYAEKKDCGVLGSGTFDRFLNAESFENEEEEDETNEKRGPAYRHARAKRRALARLR